MEEIEQLGNLQKLELKPNDIVVLNLEGTITQSKYDKIQERWDNLSQSLGIDNKLLVLENGSKIGVLAKADDTKWFKDLQRMNLKPDDIVVLKFEDMLCESHREAVQSEWKIIQENLGISNKILILDNGTDIGILGIEK